MADRNGVETVPIHTSLQRALVQFMRSGGEFHYGAMFILREDADGSPNPYHQTFSESMKRILLLITLLLFPLCASSIDLVTEKGKVYEGCNITAVLPHGVRIRNGNEVHTAETMLPFQILADESLSGLLKQVQSPEAKETITAIQRFRKQRAKLKSALDEKLRKLSSIRSAASWQHKVGKITRKHRNELCKEMDKREKKLRAEYQKKAARLEAEFKEKIASAEKAAADAERKSLKENAAAQGK